MYVEIAKERFSPSSVFVSKLNYAFQFSEFSLFSNPRGTSTLVAAIKICIELLDYRTGPDPLAAGEGSGPLGTYSGERVLVSWGGSEPSVAA